MSITEIRKRAEKIMTDASAQKLNIEKKIESANEMIKQSSEAMTTAYNDADVKAYHIAQDEIRSAKDALEMYDNQLKALDKQSLISEEEYERMSSDIIKELTEITEESKEKIFSLIEQIFTIRDDLNNAVKTGNDLLFILQAQVYRDRDYLDAPEIMQFHKIKKFQGEASLKSFVNGIEHNGYYRKEG